MPDDVLTGRYLYCIIRCDKLHQFSSRGIGEHNPDVYTIHANDLAAVVSDSPCVEYKQSRRNLMAHTMVLEEVMKDFTILPMRFGIIAPGTDVIQKQLLVRRYDEIDRALREMEGRIERGLKAFWYEGAIFQEIVNDAPHIRDLRDSLAGRSVQETYYDRIQLGEMVENAMNQKREQDAERILSHLRRVSLQVKLNSVVTDRMVVNAAFLIEKQQADAFDQAIQQLDQEMGKRLLFKYISLVPPYNFVNMRIDWKAE
jgi:hypothetical protein